eukprot:NODE_1216_length_646_cov_491.241206_g955_i0.p1 GENE.NODE_1216_length_646_cov_491.241206_g955_i0~~NODE_1216_length_646_cov_491.241206_g955_i0.p1  ORF type:complete len:196 (+),score=53.12 NODE_1216_length_646_cov_491.241206_g955_i0:23-589(+)
MGGGYHSLVLGDNKILAMGSDDYGQLGVGRKGAGKADSTVPVVVILPPALSHRTIIQVSAGEQHSLLLTSDSVIFGWGHNFYGQVGDDTKGAGNNKNRPSATIMPSDMEMTIPSVVSGAFHNMILTNTNYMYPWGWNAAGQCGDQSTNNRRKPVLVPPPQTFIHGTQESVRMTKLCGGKEHSMLTAHA